MKWPDEGSSTSVELTDEVQDFYDRYPYPPPVVSLEEYRERWRDPQRRRADYHLFWPASPYREDHSILVAGCGTSQAAKHALRWPLAQITAIDFSATSVRSTNELKKKYDLTNLEIRQLPIERAEDLGTSFDQIVCTGVLHHLVDPDAGLRALHSVLKRDGAMHLMVYALYGRCGIYMLQEACRRIGIRAADGEIPDLIRALGLLPPGHPLENLLRQAPDFRNEAALADALLHPQDRAYSVPQLFDFLDRGNLKFGRWAAQAPYCSRCGVLARIPQARRLQQLSLTDQYVTAELLRGTMIRHSVVAYRNDSAVRQEIRFTGDAWLGYIPIRVPDTVCLEERMPPGVAASLINRTHTFKDLVVTIDADEKRLFDAIDGTRSIGMIAQTTVAPGKTSPSDRARSFFEKLWWYDQIVFDASQTAGDASS
jgi:SAM-dependent methyltransferase